MNYSHNPSASRNTTTGGVGTKIRILVVDDEVDAAEGVQEILEMEGHIVGVAQDHTSALQAAKLMTPDVALVDLRLKDEWGLDVIHDLRQVFPDIVCIVQTGNSDSSVVISALRQGVYDYLVKPFEPDQLLTVISRAAEKITLQHERTEMTTQLSAARDRAELANRSKTEFLTRMGSELAEHFETLVSLANSMSNQQFGPLGDPSYQTCASGISAGCARMLDNMKHIGELGYLEAGKVVPKVSEFELVDLIQETASQHAAELSRKQLTARAGISENMPSIQSDRGLMKQIFQHLLSNAVKFAPHGTSVDISAQMDARGDLSISISDQGPGIDPSSIELAMAPFGRVPGKGDEVGNDPFAAGLGLPLASRLAGVLGGDLKITPNQPSGLTAILQFPRSSVFEFAKRRSEYL